ncbi:MAG TPA: ABC transporter substrate-binding protein [Trebonia sp.]
MATDPRSLQPISIETSGIVFSLPYFVARDEGYFEEEGLDVKFVPRDKEGKPSLGPIEDHQLVSSFGPRSPFEDGETQLYRACEWGQVRRSYDSGRGGRVIAKRSAVASQAIFVRADDPASIPQDLAGRTVGVNFHHGSHYIAIQSLEGFLNDDEIKIVHAGDPQARFESLRDGTIDAVALMEPWIAVAEKLGYKLIVEAHYVGTEIAGPELSDETFAAINRAVSRAARKLTEDPRPYLHYLVDDVPAGITTLEPADFRLGRLRYVDPAPYSERDFQRTYDWMVKWGLIEADSSFRSLVDNRVAV